jgi:hypothetical protein
MTRVEQMIRMAKAGSKVAICILEAKMGDRAM